MAKKNFYDVLGVHKNAGDDELKKAYRDLAKKHHPDANPGQKKDSEEKFKELGEAYDVLMDGDKRAAYDRFGHAAFEQGGGFRGGFHDPFDIFREVFGGGSIFEDFFGGGRSDPSQRQRGDDEGMTFTKKVGQQVLPPADRITVLRQDRPMLVEK